MKGFIHRIVSFEWRENIQNDYKETIANKLCSKDTIRRNPRAQTPVNSSYSIQPFTISTQPYDTAQLPSCNWDIVAKTQWPFSSTIHRIFRLQQKLQFNFYTTEWTPFSDLFFFLSSKISCRLNCLK